MERKDRIHRFMQNNECPNCRMVPKGFEVSKRTMKRDIGFIKERMKLPIGLDVPRFGCWYAERVSVASVGAV